MDIIYGDSLMLLNFLIDYLLLLATGHVLSLPLRRPRLALAAVLGAVYALAAVLRPGLWGSPPVKLLAGAAMVGLAYGRQPRYVRRLLVFFAVSAAFGGAVHAACSLAGLRADGRVYIPVSGRVLLLSFAVCYALLTLCFAGSARRAERAVVRVELRWRGRVAGFAALLDSGNELTDPVSARPVLVADRQALAALFPPDALAERDAAALLLRVPGLRLLSCGTATGHSLLPCFTPDAALVNGSPRALTVAIAPEELSPDGQYHGLLAP